MRRTMTTLFTALLLLAAPAAGADETPGQSAGKAGVGETLWQESMNVFRRHAVPSAEMFTFYGDVLGLDQLQTFDVGGAGAASEVARFQIGDSQVKFTPRVDHRTYQDGGVTDATGLRLLTFFFEDEAALRDRFRAHNLPAPEFQTRNGRRSAIVEDPDGQMVELVVGEPTGGIEIGLTVSDMDKSRAFYRDFVGLEPLGAADDAIFGGTKHSFRHGSTVVTLREFGGDLPADTGSGGIQYVVSDVDAVDRAASARDITVEQPLQSLEGFDLRTIWLNDPDGVTNYFAETGVSRGKSASAQ